MIEQSENEDLIPRINLKLIVFLNYRQLELPRRKPENRKVQPTTFVSDEAQFISLLNSNATFMVKDVLLDTLKNFSNSEHKFPQT